MVERAIEKTCTERMYRLSMQEGINACGEHLRIFKAFQWPVSKKSVNVADEGHSRKKLVTKKWHEQRVNKPQGRHVGHC